MFSWDEIPGNDNSKLIEFLKQKFEIDWVKTARIEKNGNIIKVSTEKNYVSLNLDQKKTQVIFVIDDGRVEKFIAKMENGKLNIFEPPPKIIQKSHMKAIIEEIHEGTCVPFLGAAANIGSGEYSGLPLGPGVAEGLVDSLDLEVRDPEDLSRVALQGETETGRQRLIKKLKEIIPDSNREPSPLLRTLAKLPFKLFITSNYDILLERALEEEGRDFKTIIQLSQGFENKRSNKWFKELENYDGVLIYKIHGTFLNGSQCPNHFNKIYDKSYTFLKNVLSSEQLIELCFDQSEAEKLSPIIVTEDDYIEFLTVVGMEKDKIGIPNLIKSKIGPSTLLFLGYSLEDWDFRTLYKGLIEKLPTHLAKKSFAFQKDPSGYWVNYWRERKVEIYNKHVYEFAKELEEKYNQKYKN